MKRGKRWKSDWIEKWSWVGKGRKVMTEQEQRVAERGCGGEESWERLRTFY